MLLVKHEYNKAWYCPVLFWHFYGVRQSRGPYKCRKGTSYYPAILKEQDWSIKDLVYSEIFWFIYCPRVPYGTGCHYVPNIYSFFPKFSQPNKNQEWLDYFKSWWRKPAVFVFFVLTFFCCFFATLLPTLSKYFELCKCAPCNFFSYVGLK